MPLKNILPDVSFRTKVLVPVVACMVAIVAVTIFEVNRQVMQQVKAQGQSTMEQAERVFRYSEKLREKNFLFRVQSTPKDIAWLSLLQKCDEKGDGASLQIPFQALVREQGVHAVLYTSNIKGVLDCESRDPLMSKSAFEKAVEPSVNQALEGDQTVPSDTVLVGDQLYYVVSIPVTTPGGELLGAVTFGSELGVPAAHELSDLTHNEITLLADGRVLASTMPGRDDSQIVSAFNESISAGGKAVSPANTQQRMVDGEHYFSAAGRLASLDSKHNLGYVLLDNSYEKLLSDAQMTRLVLLGFSFCAIFVGAMIVWLLVNKVTQPLRELRDSAEAVGRGDFTRRVPVRYRDECGELAVVFNQMTENLQQSRTDLEHTVLTLKGTQAQLVQSEKLSAVGEFVAGVAHELNNPLAAVMGFSEILKDADVDAKYRRYLEMIFKSAQRCQKIVRSLLSFARRHQPERAPVSVNFLVETVLEIVSYQLRTGNIEVTTQFDPNLPVVLADGHQIQQVLLNVVNNARQAMENHQPEGWIKIITEASDENVRIVIHDNGPGIPEENMRRIFDPFFTTKEVGQGTGLGLSLCYGIIKEHGGTITPLNRHGGGATFIIELPILQATGDTTEMLRLSETSPKKNPREGAGKNILVIDDEETILEVLREELVSHGYNVEVATGGEAGLRRLKQNYCDVVFCDWKMPGLNGRQVYENLRTVNPHLCRRVVFITGDMVNEPMRGFLEKEKRPCLAKPFTFDEVRDAIKTVLAAA
jgi:two-component system, NtrC family, sensor kinase